MSILCLLNSALFCLCANPAPQSDTLRIQFDLQYRGQALVLENQWYRNAAGDSLSIDQCRFYISGLQLAGPNGGCAEPESYHLIDAEQAESRTLRWAVGAQKPYNKLIFNVGTDSLINVAGAQGGDLDPTLGMYWAWNSGYINVKIEGRSLSCRSLHHRFEFHLGGYLPPHPTVRRIELPIQVSGKEKLSELRVRVDLAEFFDQISLAKTSQIMIPSKQAAQLSDYFKNIFSIL